MPKEALLLSAGSLNDFRAPERAPNSDLPRGSRYCFSVALVRCRAVGSLEAAECGLYGGEPCFGHQVAVRPYRPVGKSTVSFSVSLTKARLIWADHPVREAEGGRRLLF